MEQRFDTRDTKRDGDVQRLDQRIDSRDGKIDSVERRLDERIDSVENQVAQYRDSATLTRDNFQDPLIRFGVHHHGDGNQPTSVATLSKQAS